MSADAMRAAFEANIEDRIFSSVGLAQSLERDSMGDYVTGWVESNWHTWQAATLKERERAALVCVRVGGQDTDFEAYDCAAAIRSGK